LFWKPWYGDKGPPRAQRNMKPPAACPVFSGTEEELERDRERKKREDAPLLLNRNPLRGGRARGKNKKELHPFEVAAKLERFPKAAQG